MRIQVVSDLHLDLHRDRGSAFIKSLKPAAEVLVLAGDICSVKNMSAVLGMFCFKWKHVVYIFGNHEFYGSHRDTVIEEVRKAVEQNPNLHWLDCNAVEIEGQRFLGTPLWFREAPLAPKWAMNDFSEIKEYERWVYRENERARHFLWENCATDDVVITHHLPSPASIHPQFKNSALNPFFLCDMRELIQRKQPKLWIHGHTHCVQSYDIGPTRVVCNPRGYIGEHTGFQADLVLEL